MHPSLTHCPASPMPPLSQRQVAVRGVLSNDTSFNTMAMQSSLAMLEAHAHALLPLAEVVTACGVKRIPNVNPIFQVLFQYVPDGAAVQPRMGDLEVSLQPAPTMKQAKADLNVFISGTGHVSVDYMSEIFDEATVAGVAESYARILGAATEDPSATVWMLPLAVDAGQLADFCQESLRPEYLEGPLAFEKFEALAASQPDRPCLVFEGQSQSYRLVNERANALANALLELGVGPDVPVGVMLDRSFELPTSFLAAMKVSTAAPWPCAGR